MKNVVAHVDFGRSRLVDPRAFMRLYRIRFELPLWLACKLSAFAAEIRYNPYRS